LVMRRKAHTFPDGLLNPADINGGQFDSEHLGPWSCWQCHLWADAVIVGQDWGDEAQFLKCKGAGDDLEPTNLNLAKLALGAGWDLGTPRMPNPQPVFLTNAVLGIRSAIAGARCPTSHMDR
jgi:DNA polymerase